MHGLVSVLKIGPLGYRGLDSPCYMYLGILHEDGGRLVYTGTFIKLARIRFSSLLFTDQRSWILEQ